ncbi:MAG TPA: 3-deoxy-D-manno-octulosonic acid transferase [Candidatus Deferrimicrobiaceae bacterium]|nr:3-deoxy-D-manno-octulosonic acid transferase [Candidatus Deferrimicrobiaceae bacterium]
MYALYSAVLAVGLLAYLPAFLARRRRAGYGRNLAQRLGRLGHGLPPEPRCWIHAVSVGESAAAVPLVEGIRRRWPELGIVVTTITPTGARIVAERLAGTAVHRYFPIDLPRPVRRALDAARPRFFIAIETELWPNFLRALARRRVPAMIANGRISDRSFRRYHWVRGLMRRVLADVAVFAMQTEEDARRIIALGAPRERVVVTGNLKSDLLPEASPDDARWRERLGLGADARLWIAGSTHRGEEALVLDAFAQARARCPQLALILAPRHPERTGEVEALIRERGLGAVRRSQLPGDAAPGAIVILDTVGELAALYALAEVVFVGGSLVPVGGHNVLEPAMRGKPVLTGPHTSNFREGVELLQRSGGGLVVKDGADLARELRRLLEDRDLARRMGEAARLAFAGRQGAVSATLDLVGRHLWRRAEGTAP